MYAHPQELKCLKIEILDPDIIHQSSVLKITNPTVQFENRTGTVFDLKLGSTSYHEKCNTCGSRHHECHGHFGHIDLNMKFYQPFFLPFVYKILQQHCWNCYKYRGDANSCPHCNKNQGKWGKDGQYKDKFFHKAGHTKKEFTSDQVYQILRDHDTEFPKRKQPATWLMLTVLPVAPTCIRPSILNSGNWSHNSLSHTYANIVKENNLLQVFQTQHQPHHIILQQWRRTQDQIYKIYDVRNANEERYMEGMRQRLNSKQGRFRKNLLGTCKLSF